MADLYSIIELLCTREGIKPGKLCSDVGISRGILSDLKSGRSKSLSYANMQKIAAYFGVSTDIFNDGFFEEAPLNSVDRDSLRPLLFAESIKKKAPTPGGEREIGLDDFTYAMHNESKNLSQESKDRLLQMARFFAEEERKRGTQ